MPVRRTPKGRAFQEAREALAPHRAANRELLFAIGRLVGQRNLEGVASNVIKRAAGMDMVVASVEQKLVDDILGIEIPGLDRVAKLRLVRFVVGQSRDAQRTYDDPAALLEASAPNMLGNLPESEPNGAVVVALPVAPAPTPVAESRSIATQ